MNILVHQLAQRVIHQAVPGNGGLTRKLAGNDGDRVVPTPASGARMPRMPGAFNYSTETWVNFKLFGFMGLMLVFVVAQGLMLGKYMQENEDKEI